MASRILHYSLARHIRRLSARIPFFGLHPPKEDGPAAKGNACRRGQHKGYSANSYHRCYFTHICYLVIAIVSRSTLIIVVTSPAMQCYFTSPFHVLSDSAIPQLSHPYPKKRDYLCHDIVRAVPVRCKTPRVHHALFYK